MASGHDVLFENKIVVALFEAKGIDEHLRYALYVGIFINIIMIISTVSKIFISLLDQRSYEQTTKYFIYITQQMFENIKTHISSKSTVGHRWISRKTIVHPSVISLPFLGTPMNHLWNGNARQNASDVSRLSIVSEAQSAKRGT